jgi:hypothetical protein
MVQGKKANDMSNGTNKYQSSSMAFQRNNLADPRGAGAGKNDGKPQNGESDVPFELRVTDIKQATPASSEQTLRSLAPKFFKANVRSRNG